MIVHTMSHEETIMFRWVFSAIMAVWIPYFVWIFSRLHSPSQKNDGIIILAISALSLISGGISMYLAS